jgi:alkaline phosphatase
MKTLFDLRRILLVFMAILLALQLNSQPIGKRPDNIILMIGDGMGVSQVYAGLTANHGQLYILNLKNTGFSLTYSANSYITDSGAGATAIASGKKTYNGAIGVGPDTVPCKTILEYAEEKGLATGLVVTSSITHATPAAFIAHQKSRNYYEQIATDFLKTDIDVFIGGGRNNFAKRSDNVDLIKDLRNKSYQVVFSPDSIGLITQGKLAALIAEDQPPAILQGRGNMLPVATETAINILDKNRKGFFLMVEGSQIDWGGHLNNADYVISEMIDFDQAIGKALAFAVKDRKTLIIVTADHETGGLSLTGGNFKTGMVTAKFNSTDHTGVMVPVFAYGPGAELFEGIQENTDLFDKMMSLLRLK